MLVRVAPRASWKASTAIATSESTSVLVCRFAAIWLATCSRLATVCACSNSRRLSSDSATRCDLPRGIVQLLGQLQAFLGGGLQLSVQARVFQGNRQL